MIYKVAMSNTVKGQRFSFSMEYQAKGLVAATVLAHNEFCDGPDFRIEDVKRVEYPAV